MLLHHPVCPPYQMSPEILQLLQPVMVVCLQGELQLTVHRASSTVLNNQAKKTQAHPIKTTQPLNKQLGHDKMSVMLTEIFVSLVLHWTRGREISGTHVHDWLPILGCPPMSTPPSPGSWMYSQGEGGNSVAHNEFTVQSIDNITYIYIQITELSFYM